MEQLRKALETRDAAAVEALLAEDVVFRSPALFKPYAGRAATMVFLRAAMETFEDFRYVRTYTEDDGRGHVLMFAATVGGRELEGADFVVARRGRAGQRVPGDDPADDRSDRRWPRRWRRGSRPR